MRNQDFIQRLKCILNVDFYDFTKTKFLDFNHKVIITCKTHGDFLVSPINVLYHNSKCPICSRENMARSKSMTQQEFENIIKRQFNGEIAVLSKYTKTHQVVKIICKKCGREYFKTPANIFNWDGCKCSKS